MIASMTDFSLDKIGEMFSSDDYRRDLEELSIYASHIKQERPMIYLLAKYLNRRGFDVVLEWKEKDKSYDLVVNFVRIEAKFYYESDLIYRLKKEAEDADWKIENLLGKRSNWYITKPILKDIVEKNTDILILIIVSRDLSKISNDELFLKKICWSQIELKYVKEFGFNNSESFSILDRFFELVKKRRPFSVVHMKLETNSGFPSIYHIFVCDFRK